jgi:hypothetical protein
MNFPILFVRVDNADEYMKHLIAYKTAYEKIITGEEELDDDEVQDLLSSLSVNYFKVKGLHTIIFLDDSINSRLLKPNSYISSLLSENRQSMCYILY